MSTLLVYLVLLIHRGPVCPSQTRKAKQIFGHVLKCLSYSLEAISSGPHKLFGLPKPPHFAQFPNVSQSSNKRYRTNFLSGFWTITPPHDKCQEICFVHSCEDYKKRLCQCNELWFPPPHKIAPTFNQKINNQ